MASAARRVHRNPSRCGTTVAAGAAGPLRIGRRPAWPSRRCRATASGPSSSGSDRRRGPRARGTRSAPVSSNPSRCRARGQGSVRPRPAPRVPAPGWRPAENVFHDLFPRWPPPKKPRVFGGCRPRHPAADHVVHGLL